MKTEPIVFLDFDGVTHPEPSPAERKFESLPRIEAVLRQHPGVSIVLSTSWRENHALDDLRDLFSSDMMHRVIDGTPIVTRYVRDWYPVRLSERIRQCEVEAWLHENRTLVHPWIAIDDRAGWFEIECENLLVTDKTTGFTEADSDRLHQMILKRRS
jgi:hypothetical protein